MRRTKKGKRKGVKGKREEGKKRDKTRRKKE